MLPVRFQSLKGMVGGSNRAQLKASARSVSAYFQTSNVSDIELRRLYFYVGVNVIRTLNLILDCDLVIQVDCAVIPIDFCDRFLITYSFCQPVPCSE